MSDAQVTTGTYSLARDVKSPVVARVKGRRLVRLGVVAVSLAGDGVTVTIALAVIGTSYPADAGLADATRLLYLLLPAYSFATWAIQGQRLAVFQERWKSIAHALAALSLALIFSLAAAFAFGQVSSFLQSRTLWSIGFAAFALSGFRWCLASVLRRNAPAFAPSVALLGDESVGAGIFQHAEIKINAHADGWRLLASDPNFLNEIAQVISDADRIILSFHSAEERQDWCRLIRQLGLGGEILEPELAASKPLALDYFGSTPSLVFSRPPLTVAERTLKRAIDLTCVFLSLPIVLPLVGLLAVLIRLDSPGPVLFLQSRIGMNSQQFKCYKFRTMRADTADQAGNQLTRKNDDRITRLGAFLRRSSLDELPQLWNVIRGDMSLVGPRPHALGASADGALYWEAVSTYWERHSVKPGITGLAQIRGFRGPTETRRAIENRVTSDLEYIRTWSIWLDLKILIRTVSVLVHSNAF